jgi:hypothetical protein
MIIEFDAIIDKFFFPPTNIVLSFESLIIIIYLLRKTQRKEANSHAKIENFYTTPLLIIIIFYVNRAGSPAVFFIDKNTLTPSFFFSLFPSPYSFY